MKKIKTNQLSQSVSDYEYISQLSEIHLRNFGEVIKVNEVDE